MSQLYCFVQKGLGEDNQKREADVLPVPKFDAHSFKTRSFLDKPVNSLYFSRNNTNKTKPNAETDSV